MGGGREHNAQNVILIIGESLAKHHLSLYGYHLPTTPNLLNLQTSDNLIAFIDVVAPYASTSPVLQRLLTFSDYESERARTWSESLNIVDLFKLWGFKTSWISNQEMNGIYTAPITAIAKRADVVKFSAKLNSSGSNDNARYDGELLNLLQQTRTGRDFYVIHLLGSHIKYQKRYPSEFAKFSADDIAAPLNLAQRNIIAQYDNSVLYNDYVINEIYKAFAQENSLIIYISDHGESLYEHKGLLGHGFTSRQTLEVPLVFIASDKFKVAHAELWQKLKLAKNKAFMSDILAHTLADLIGAVPLEFDASRSLLRDDYNASRRRIVGEERVDYESLRE